jgi:hypothetical protein
MPNKTNDIGPFYKGVGFFCIFSAVGLVVIQHLMGHPLEWLDVAIVGILVLASIALIRPDKFDNLIKNIADALPFVKYTKPKE